MPKKKETPKVYRDIRKEKVGGNTPGNGQGAIGLNPSGPLKSVVERNKKIRKMLDELDK